MGHTVLGNADRAHRRRNRNKRLEVGRLFGPGGMPLPNIGSMDCNTGRSEGATAEKAVPFPWAVLDPSRSFVDLRVGEPRPGARSVSHRLRPTRSGARTRVAAFPRRLPSKKSAGAGTPMASTLSILIP